MEEAKPEEKAEEVPAKGNPRQPKSTKPEKPTECASTGKPLLKKLWYYRDGKYYANKKAYLRKREADRVAAEEEKKKANEEAAS